MSEKTEYYPVHGTGKKAITQSLRKNSPHKKGQNYYPAYTQTDIKYQYTWGNRAGRCSVVKVKVFLTLTYVYPQLSLSQSSQTQTWWNEKVRKFEIHEKIHGNISKRAAHELDRKLRALKGINCSNAKQIITNRARFIIRQMKNSQAEYDRITRHGLEQHKYHGPK
ncbi:DUF922 domain-containing Zn-dependent protease [Pseudodesulfovibrio piezophilus]|uniref:DUF922 domain-containing Zn-dependent protease n=1 Tax=Pseudodesulfovibrio piezophilus TaxID=879567 RepID=UPI0012FED077|nr:DUF922 domain-containing Zn-dependent protease [Pseudodesulfovibrio piezophilus]